MKAAVLHGPGDVRVEQVPEPGPPGPGEVVVQVIMGALCGTDAAQYRHATMVPLASPHPSSRHRGPVILGHEVVGTVVALGAGVEHLTLGQRVVPGAGCWCGQCLPCRKGRENICERSFLYGIHANGGLAECATFPAMMCLPVPEGCSDAAAVMAQPCAVALHALNRVRITQNQTIALFGAGSIGSLMLAVMQAARTRVSGEVGPRMIVVDVDNTRLETARRLGASHVLNAGTTDVEAGIRSLTGGSGVDVAIEASGVPSSIVHALEITRRGGRLLQVGIPHQPVSLPLGMAVMGEKEIVTSNGQNTGIDLSRALSLLATTDLAERIGYRVIDLDAIVEEGLVPLVKRRASAKTLVKVAHVSLD